MDSSCYAPTRQLSSEARSTRHIALIVDMELPGIEVTVIRDLTGGEPSARWSSTVPRAGRLPVGRRGPRLGRGDGHTGQRALVGTAGLSVSMRIELDNLIATARKHNPTALEDPESATGSPGCGRNWSSPGY